MSETGTLTKLCETADVSEDLPFRAEIDGFGYAIFQAGDQYYVTADLCSHGPGFLSDGFIEGCEVECPFHQGRFDVRTGQPTAPPCEVPIKVWTPVVSDEAIFIDISAGLS
ncbi:Rieske (2Fe-2S) iron-sulfur domain-containing protein [Rhizobium sp. CF080]|uniref:non-heme iron oxygenase ferredoxin subunit n=1 Tax=Rhizobium sp. (strain CF080) TaxID=1144310 RepID=UPI000271D752|nr:non-heme iron oxygenase ferredoxin subunit [Rhizobium sp. CF080]EUB99425.1 Rieske (2Fe-2S) iron-sulfur domain-containing protein [Rhizobium sp. CF080]